jgi:hypothetical protein
MKNTDVISGFLHQGENVLWIGRPGFTLAPTPTERLHLVTLVLFVAALGFVLFARRGLEGEWGAFWVTAGLLGLATLVQFLSVLKSIRRRAGIVYCLTNERALIIEQTDPRSRAFLRIAYDTPIAVTEHRKGRGHIAFGRKYDFDTEEWPIFRGFAFYDIRDVARVVGLIERLQDGMAPPGTVPGIKAMAKGDRDEGQGTGGYREQAAGSGRRVERA